MTVTVIRVYPNGNLEIKGQKKLILNENDIINNNSPSILSLTNEKNKSENETYPMFTPSQWKKQKLIYTTKLYAEFNDIVFVLKLLYLPFESLCVNFANLL